MNAELTVSVLQETMSIHTSTGANTVAGEPIEERAANRRITRNFAVLTVGQLFSRGLAVVSNVYLARVLGADAFGAVTFALTILSYPELLVNLGFIRLGPREVVRNPDPDNVRRVVRSIITIRSILSLAAFGIFTLIVFTLPDANDLERRSTLIYGVYLFFVVLDLGWVFLGTERMHIVSIADILVQVVTVIGTFLFVRRPEDLGVVALIYLASQAVSILAVLALYTRQYGLPGFGANRDEVRSLVKAAIPIALTRSMGTINLNFDTLLVGFIMTSFAVGLYGAAYRFIWVPSLVVAMYFNAVTPAFDRAYRHGLDSIDTLLNRSVRWTGALGIGFAVGGMMFAPIMFGLVFTPEYQGAVLPFQILIWTFPFIFISRNYRTLLVSFDQQGAQLKLMVVAALTNILFNVVLIPLYGLMGAALATVAAEMVIFVLSYVYVHLVVGHVPLGRHLPKLAGLGLVTTAALIATVSAPLVVQLAAGAATYIGGLFLFRVITLYEVNGMIRTWLPRRNPA